MQTALITGGLRGIGRIIAMTLVREGMAVVINDLKNGEEAETLMREIKEKGVECLFCQGDIGDEKDCERIVQRAMEKFGKIDILVNNAGIIRDNLFMSMEKKDWDAVVRTNLNGLFNMTQAVAKEMMMKRSGKIVNISSIAAAFGGKGQANYAATKAGINALTRVLALELGRKNITVNAIAPGMIETRMSGAVRNLAGEEILSRIPLRRFGQPEDIAEVVLFLVSDKANYITGQVITIDGGLSLGLY